MTSRATISQTEQRIRLLRAANSRLLAEEQSLLEEHAHLSQQITRVRALERQHSTFSLKYETTARHTYAAGEDLALAQEKIDALTDHIEKLSGHLQHEAAAKAKAVTARARAQAELAALKSRNAMLSKRSSEREALIADLKEGTRILEDQLRLMDERYIELRGKLDWTQAHSSKQVAKIMQRTQRLEQKWDLARTMTGNNATFDALDK